MAKVEIDVGGAGSGSYIAESGFSGGSTTNAGGATMIVTGIIDPPPAPVLDTVRFDGTSFSKTITGLTVGEDYRFRVHSCWLADYSFAVKINTVTKATITKTLAEGLIVHTADFTAQPDGSGQIIISFEKVTGAFALVNALQYWQVTGGSTVPDDVTGFGATAELAAGVTLVWDEGTDDTNVEGYRIQRDTVNTFNSLDFQTWDTEYAPQSYFESLDGATTYYYRIKAIDGDGNLSANWATDNITTSAATAKINSGGASVSDWIADVYATGGTPQTYLTDADTTGLTDPAPAQVYKETLLQGTGSISYAIPNLRPNGTYLVRCHYRLDSGSQIGEMVLSEGKYISTAHHEVAGRAQIREFYTTISSDGIMNLQWDYLYGGNSYITGIELTLATAPVENATVNIVIMGDSITQGNAYTHVSYPHYLSELFLNANSFEFDTSVVFDSDNLRSVRNLGISGNTLSNMEGRFPNDVPQRLKAGATNIFILLGGSNDLTGGSSAATLEGQISGMCDDAYSAGYDYVFVSTVTPRSDVVGANETKRLALNTLLTTNFASYADGVIDYAGNSEFDDVNGPNYISEAVKVHWSAAGNAIAAQMVYDALLPYVPKVVHVTWDASTDDVAVTGYKVRRAEDSGFTINVVDVTVGDVLEYNSEAIVTTPKTFFFKVLAFDAGSNESEYSTPQSILVDP